MRKVDGGWFLAWVAVGALAAMGVLALLSIGLVLWLAAVVGAVLLARTGRGATGISGLITGASLPLLFVAWSNRSGPGTVCSRISGGESCVQEWAPLPWLAAGVVLMVAGVVMHAMRAGTR